VNRTARNAATDTAMAALYAQVPAIPGCKGLCHTSCGPIEMSNRERQKIRDRHGVDIPELPRGPRLLLTVIAPKTCPALTPLNRCGVYDDRPMLCRLWGAVENLPCVYGCVPDGGRLPNVDGAALLAESFEVGGSPPSRRARGGAAAVRAKAADQPALFRAVEDYMAAGSAGDAQVARDRGLLP